MERLKLENSKYNWKYWSWKIGAKVGKNNRRWKGIFEVIKFSIRLNTPLILESCYIEAEKLLLKLEKSIKNWKFYWGWKIQSKDTSHLIMNFRTSAIFSKFLDGNFPILRSLQLPFPTTCNPAIPVFFCPNQSQRIPRYWLTDLIWKHVFVHFKNNIFFILYFYCVNKTIRNKIVGFYHLQWFIA